ncbi:glycosyltransferase family 4 protein [Vibrio cholerae]
MIAVISSNTTWYIYNFRKGTIKALLSKGYDVVAVSPKDKYVNDLEKLGVKHFHIDIDRGGTNPIKDIKTFIHFYLVYKKISPQIVLNFTPKNNIYSTLAAKILNIPAVNNIAGLGSVFIGNSFVTRLTKLLYRVSQRFSEKIFFQNDEDLTIFLENNIISEDKAQRIPGSGVDLIRFKESFKPIDSGCIKFILVARMLLDKGVLHYAEAAKELSYKHGEKVKFYLLGPLDEDAPSGIKLIEIQKIEKESNLHYLGTSDEVEKIISDVDCMVLPSYYREGVPKSLLEGAAMGKPIITTDNVGCREVVDHGVNGFLCEPRSTSSLIEQMEKFIALPYAQKLEMGSNSRIKVENEFDEQIVIKKYLDAIENILQEK